MFSAMAAMLLIMLATDLNPPGLWFSARATLSRNCSRPWACIEIKLELNYNLFELKLNGFSARATRRCKLLKTLGLQTMSW